MDARRFKIAFSFAGEQRSFVAAVAQLLAQEFGEDKILYDKFHEAEFAVFNLGIRLPKLYGEQSDLIVPVLCPRYDVKRWTGWEWLHIYGLLTQADGHRVMPCRFEHATADGLSPAAGFIELDDKTPEQTATLILQRLALNEGKSKDHYTVTPGAIPTVRYVLVISGSIQSTDHSRVQGIFNHLQNLSGDMCLTLEKIEDGSVKLWLRGSREGFERLHALKQSGELSAALQLNIDSLREQTDVLKTAIPNNLPRLQSFFGREKELKQIHDALAPEARTWGALIDGPGGMGKTSLAVRAAYDSPPGRFDRIIFVSVKGEELEDDGPRGTGNFLVPGFLEMLNELARELGQSDLAKSPEGERSRLLLEALRPVKALLILDNLESLPKTDRDQLFTFVKRLPGGCKAILTSRRRIGSSADVLILERLDEAAALATLEEMAPRNPLLARTKPEERLRLYMETDGKPLLLRWTAGQLGRGHCRTVGEALAFLRSCPADNDPLEFIFGDLAQDFTPEETRVLVALTFFTQPATVPHIAEVAGMAGESGSSRREEAPSASGGGSQSLLTSAATLAAVETALHTLANRSLVVPNQEEKAFVLVPMVAEFLRKKRPEVVAKMGNRLEQRAYEIIEKNGRNKHDRFPIIEAAWAIVTPALPLFLAGPNDRLQTACHYLSDFLSSMGHWDERLSLFQQAETKAVASSDYIQAGWRAYAAGYVLFLRQQADEVMLYAERAETHWIKAGAGARERSRAIRLRGLGHQLKGEYVAAIAAHNQTLVLVRILSEENYLVAISLKDLAEVKRLSRLFEAAEQDYREALRVAQAVGYKECVAHCMGDLAALSLDQGDWLKAETLAREALPLAKKVSRQELVAENCRHLAKALARQGKGVEGLPHAQRAVEIYTQLRSPDLEKARAILKECET